MVLPRPSKLSFCLFFFVIAAGLLLRTFPIINQYVMLGRIETNNQQVEDLQVHSSTVDSKSRVVDADLLFNGKRPVAYDNPVYYAHVPKTGGRGALRHFNKVLFDRNTGNKCNHGPGSCVNKRTLNWTAWVARGTTHGCYLHMSEYCWYKIDVAGPRPEHAFTMLRPAHHHVLSQYLHCTESGAHKNRRKWMPSLEEWLQAWADEKRQLKNTTVAGRLELVAKIKRRFKCYNPWDHASTLLRLPANITAAGLRTQFDVVGLLPEFSASTCLMAVYVLRRVPPACDCGTGGGGGVASRVVSHGVSQHGDSLNITTTERALIDGLTEVDARLYGLAEELFREALERVNRQYSVRLCTKYKW